MVNAKRPVLLHVAEAGQAPPILSCETKVSIRESRIRKTMIAESLMKKEAGSVHYRIHRAVRRKVDECSLRNKIKVRIVPEFLGDCGRGQ